MEKKLIEIAVLLACYNRREKTIRCIKSLMLQENLSEKFSVEFFLVDDASTDGTADEIRRQFPNVNIITGNGSLFWCRGMHLAWKTASEKKQFDFYLWANDDVSIFPGAIASMLDNYAEADESAIICGATKSEVTGAYTYGGQTKQGVNIIPNGTLQPCVIMNGNFVLISNKVFKKVGIIDDVFHHSIGDHDYGLRAIKKGVDVLIAPDYIGFCEAHDRLPKWTLKEISVKERFKSLYSPLGNTHPYYFFVYEKRHFGLPVAVKHFFSIHLRALIPGLWK